MRTVWKFPVRTVEATISMQMGAQIVHFAAQGGRPTIWAIVDTEAKLERRHFRVFGTGEELDPIFNTHRGTCFDGPYVWHLFENTIPCTSN